MHDESIYTLAVHAGEDRTMNHGAVSVPIYTSSVFAFTNAEEGVAIHNEEKPGFYYGRLGNPTTNALEATIAQLERGEDAIAFASGMASISASILTFAGSGDHIVAPTSMYSTTTNFLRYIGEKFGIETTFVDASNAENFRSGAKSNTKIFWTETPSNPLVQITDLTAIAAVGEELGINTVTDNTFATPYIQRPLDLGVDLVVHSATKYLGGHSDLTAGLLVGRQDIIDRARHGVAKLFGGNIAPQVAWLVLRGIKTLALRMERHNSNAYVLANMLSEHPKVVNTHYPGLESHHNHEIAKRQMNGFGGIIGLDLGSAEAAKSFVNNVRICTFATSLGGVETIVQPSALMTHATLSSEERTKAGISDGLLRLSVGIEDVDDLKADIKQALEKI